MVEAVIRGHSPRPGAAVGGAWARVVTRSIRSSFHDRRSNCQVPSAASTAKTSAAAMPDRIRDARERGQPALLGSAFGPHGQGMLRICSGDIGIMLGLRWSITHSEPVRVMTTRTKVKISASMVQPPSDFGFMCRK